MPVRPSHARPGAPRQSQVTLKPVEQPVRIGLFVAEGFPLAPLSLVIEALRLANWVEGQESFTYVIVSADGESRTSSSHLPAFVNHSVESCPPLQVLLVCTGSNSSQVDDPAVMNWLRRIYRQGSRVGGISGGAFVLARAGLLYKRTCAIHWEVNMALAAAFPDVNVSGDIFVIDGRIITCAGGISTLDLMLHLIEHFRSAAVARRVADDLIYPSMRHGHEPARIALRRRTGVTNSVLLGAIEMMERNVEEPVKLSQISAGLGTSMRHLERLFSRAFGMSPSQYYMQLRLREARGLLAQTDLPLFEVALRCGFQNTSHFARRYRQHYNLLPSEERQSVL